MVTCKWHLSRQNYCWHTQRHAYWYNNVMGISILFRTLLFWKHSSRLVIWGCFSIISNIIWYNYGCRRHTMHGNGVFYALYFGCSATKRANDVETLLQPYIVSRVYTYFAISVFYFSVISRDIDLKFMQNTHRVVINSQKNDIHKVKGQGHRDGTLLFEGSVISRKLRHRKCSILFCRHPFICPIKWNNINLSEQRNCVTKNTSIRQNSYTEVTISHNII